MSDKAIPLADVRSALMLAIVRQKSVGADGKRLGRFAAYTDLPLANIDCVTARRGHKPYKLPRAHFSPMHVGDLDRVVERVRLQRGLAEVRRTWGRGIAALRAEWKAGGVMR